MRMGDTSGVPLEFIYEAADCRFFYTADMVRDVTTVWRKTVDASWGDRKQQCVDGSTSDKTSLSGGFKPSASTDKKGAGVTIGVSGSVLTAMVAVMALFAML